MSDLTGKQYGELVAALTDAYHTLNALGRMVRVELGQQLDTYTSGSIDERVGQLIDRAEARGFTGDLVEGAHRHNPRNELLREFYQRYFSSIQRRAPTPMLEKIVLKTSAFHNIAKWRTQLEKVERQVCRVELAGACGTGFLVGPSVVLTNYHVVEGAIEEPELGRDLVVRFDFKQLPDGTAVHPGTVYPAAADWLVDTSPPSPVDAEEPKSRLPEPEELDYALIRLQGEPGRALVDGQARGWVSLPAEPHRFEKDTMLYIVQHPRGEPMQLAIESQAVIDVNQNATRVSYRVPTHPGSSGSPCFEKDWKLVALHHSGDPRFRGKFGEYNEGIPIAAIRRLLADRGKLDAVGG